MYICWWQCFFYVIFFIAVFIYILFCFSFFFYVDPKSKFDDHSENESGTDSVQPSEHEETPFREGSPPASPIEDDSDLPPYLPAIQGCRSVEEFNCLNRIEEGTYGVVYRAKDKKSGKSSSHFRPCFEF